MEAFHLSRLMEASIVNPHPPTLSTSKGFQGRSDSSELVVWGLSLSSVTLIDTPIEKGWLWGGACMACCPRMARLNRYALLMPYLKFKVGRNY